MKLAIVTALALGTALVAACGGSSGTGLFGSGGPASSSSSSGGAPGSGSGGAGGSSSTSGNGGASSGGSSASSASSSTSGGTSTSSSGGPTDAALPPEAGPDGGFLGQLCDVFNSDPLKLVQWKIEAQQSVQDGSAIYCNNTPACTQSQCCFPLATDLSVCVTK